MIDAAGKLKITDFGISQPLQDTLTRVTPRRTTGTLVYMSPQQLNGEIATLLDDIYAVGASWNDAQAFCRWLTEAERQQGRITNESYRLPTPEEWAGACGTTPSKYPWGNEWPPRTQLVNIAGEEMRVDYSGYDYFRLVTDSAEFYKTAADWWR